MTRFIFMLQEISKKVAKDNLTGYAAQSCFYIILSIVPSLLVLLSFFHYLPIDAEYLVTVINAVIPAKISPLIEAMIYDLRAHSSLTLTSITAIATLWAAGKSFMSIIVELNQIYETKNNRSWLLQRIMSTVYTLLFLVLIIATLIVFIFGNQLIEFFKPFTPRIASILSSITTNKIFLFPSVLMILFLLMYIFIPTRKTTLRKEFPGAVLATTGWYAFSSVYSLYVDHSPNFSHMYGSLATLVFALIWIYTCMIIVFAGAEFNALLASGIFDGFKRHRHTKKES